MQFSQRKLLGGSIWENDIVAVVKPAREHLGLSEVLKADGTHLFLCSFNGALQIYIKKKNV